MAGKRLNLATLAGQAVETTPGSSKPTLVHVAPDQVAPTPLNPRQDFDPVQLEELGKSMATGQLQPCVGISRARYVKLFPEHEEELPDCRIVMAAGERRWKAALHVGLPHLDVHVREDIAETRVRFLAAVLTENVERANFNFIEEARGLKLMLEMTDGNQTKAAETLQKSKQWFSQRIGILRLSEEMQARVISGEIKAFREMRLYSAMPPEEQLAAWQADREAAMRPREQRASQVQPESAVPASGTEPAEESAAYTAVYTQPADDHPAQQPQAGPVPSFTAVKTEPRPDPAPEPSVNEQRPPKVDAMPEKTEGALPEPRQGGAAKSPVATTQPAEAGGGNPSAVAAWVLPAGLGWEELFHGVVAHMGEFDRHLLTRALSKVMEQELNGGDQDREPSEGAQA